MGVRSHHTGGKTSSALLPRTTSPGELRARPEHPLPGSLPRTPRPAAEIKLSSQNAPYLLLLLGGRRLVSQTVSVKVARSIKGGKG